MDTELNDKHPEMRKLGKQIRDVTIELKSSLSLVLFHTVIHQVGLAVKSKIKCINPPPSPHEKKLDKFCQRQLKLYINDSRYYINNTVHNFLSYILSSREELGLLYGLEQHTGKTE